MPPMSGADDAFATSGMSVIRQSVVRIIEATEDEKRSAEVATFAGSITPALTMSP